MLVKKRTRSMISIAYDSTILLLILLDVVLLGLDYLIVGHIGSIAAQQFHWEAYRTAYLTHYHQPLLDADEWFTLVLIAELVVRWLIAMVYSHHARWFFFPFIHWYEVLGCIPAFRVFRLLRVFAIGYRLYKMGFQILPDWVMNQARFYYDVVLEEISDRIIINVLDGVENELRNSTTHGPLIEEMLNQHRLLIQQATQELLIANVIPALQSRRSDIEAGIGTAVYEALHQVPELHSILRLLPGVGPLLNLQLQSIGRSMAINITHEILDNMIAEPNLRTGHAVFDPIAEHVGQLNFNTPKLKELLESLVFTSLDVVKKQVSVQQWKEKYPL